MSRMFTFLGTGTSVGVPMLGCECSVCTSDNPRNQRYRSSVLVRLPGGNVLIDTGPEMRLQLLRERVSILHAVLYTHYHADHLFGLDDLRPMARILGDSVPLHCTGDTESKIRQSFHYAFGPAAEQMSAGFIPKLVFRRVDENTPFTVCGQQIIPIPLEHAHFSVLGYRIEDVAYCTDVNRIPPRSWPRLEGVRVLILDALRPQPHPAHMSVDQALEVIDRIQPEQAYLTHMGHELEYEELCQRLPANVRPAYDGLSFPF